jgi:hypothetical protein
VLFGNTGPKAEDKFTLTDIRVSDGAITAIYHEPNDKAVYEVSGPVSARTWNFKGTKWITRPKGAAYSISIFSAQLDLSSDRKSLNGTYKFSGMQLSGPIFVSLTDEQP